jgi:DNA-binding Lrp family transcriptional regulator
LEHAGVIAGYRALVDRTAVGLGFEALVFVTMSGADYGTLSDFDAAVISTASIIQAQRLFGSPDYLLRVVAKDLPDFQLIYDEQLSRLPGVQKLASTLVMKSLVEGRPLPL